ncbi:hypothetical protein BH23PSE1_BH23PSE1_06280 [soil metagenome]
MKRHAPTIRRPATYQDVLDAPPHMVAELIHGTLHLQPRRAMRHSRACFAMAGLLNDPFQLGDGGPGGWHFGIEPELHLGLEVLVPDLAGWRRETMPLFPDTAAAEIAPDWVCEILSPSTRRLDTTKKRDIYGESGVRHLWFLEPIARTLEVFELDGGRWKLASTHADDDDVRPVPFEAVGFRLSALWPD